MSIASRRRKSGRLSGAVFEPVSPEEFSVRWHPITSTETAKEHMEDIMSSPDPLNESAADASIFFPPSAIRSRASRSASPQKQPASASRRSVSPRKRQPQLTSSIRRSVTRSVSPRKQTFELEVGDNTAPQRLLVTVETDENAPPSPVNTRRKLFQSPGSESTVTRRQKTTTTKVPLKDDNNVSPKKRGRPRKTNGTPVPTKKRAGTPAKAPRGTPRPSAVGPPSDTEDALSLVDVQSTPKRRGRPPKNASASTVDLAPSSASRPSARRGRPPKARVDEPSSEAGPVPSSVATAPRTAGRRRRVAMDQEELIQIADIAADATIDQRATPISSDNEMDLITMPTIENERLEALSPAPAPASPGEKSDIWLTGLDEPTPRPRKRTSRSISVQSSARKRVTRSSSESLRQDQPEEPAFPDSTPVRAPALESELPIPAPEDEYPDFPAAPSDASSLVDEPREEIHGATAGDNDGVSHEAPVQPFIQARDPIVEQPIGESREEDPIEEETPKASRLGDQLSRDPEPETQDAGSMADASDVSSIDDTPRGDKTDTIAQGEDFSMIFAHSIPSLQNSLRQSYHSGTGAPLEAPTFDDHEIGEETGLIINNTLEDLRQSQMRRSQMTNQDEERFEDEHPGDIFDRSQIRYPAESAQDDAQPEDDHPGDLFDRSQNYHTANDQNQTEQAEPDEPLRRSFDAGSTIEQREAGQQDAEPTFENRNVQPIEEDEEMPDASPLVTKVNGPTPTPQRLPAQFGSSRRSQRFQQPEYAPASSSPLQADVDDVDSPSSENAVDPSPSHAFSFAYARSPRKMSSPLRHQVLRHTARQAHLDADIPEEDEESSLRQSMRATDAALEAEDTNMYDDSFSEIPEQVLAAATPFRSQTARRVDDSVPDSQEAAAKTNAEAEPPIEIVDDDEMDLVVEDIDAPAPELEAQPQPAAEVQLQTETHIIIEESEEPLPGPVDSAAGSEARRLPTPDDTPPHIETEIDHQFEEEEAPEAPDAQLKRSSSPQPSPSPLPQSEGEEITDIEVQATNRRAVPSLQPTLSIEHVAPLPKVTPLNQLSSPLQENPSLMPPENLLNRSARPTLSPIVRAGRVLQSVTSDPPSPEGQRHLGSPFRSSASKDSDRNQADRRSASPPRKFGFPPARSSSVGAPPASGDPFRSTSRSGQHTSFFQSLGRSMSSAGGHKRAISQDSLSSLRHAPSTDGRMSWVANEGPISPRLRGDNTLREAALATFGAPDVHPLSRSTQRRASSELGDADVQRDAPHLPFGSSVYQPPAEPTEPLDQSLQDLLDDEKEAKEPVDEKMEQEPVEDIVAEPLAEPEVETARNPEEEEMDQPAAVPESDPVVDRSPEDVEASEDELPLNEPEEETDIWEFEASRIEPRSAKRQEPFGRKAPEPILRRGTIPSPWKPGKKKQPVREPSPELHPETFADGTELPSDADEFSLLAAQRRAEEQKARGGESASKTNRFDLSSFFSSPAAIPGMIAAKTMSLLGSKPPSAQTAALAKSPLATRVEESIADSSAKSAVEEDEAEEDEMEDDTTVTPTLPEQQVNGSEALPAEEPEMVQVSRPPRQQPMSTEIQPSTATVPPLTASKPALPPPPQPLYPRIPQKDLDLSSPRRDLFSPAKTNTSPKRFAISSPRKALFSPVKSGFKGKGKEKTPDATGSESPPTPQQVQMPVSAQKQNFTPRQRQSSQTYYQPSSTRPVPSQQQSATQTPPRMQLSHADIAKWREETNANGVDDSVDSPNFKRPLLRPLPPKNASPKKSSLRSPLKPHTPGPVVEFTSSVLSPLEQQQIRQSARGSLFGPDLFGQPLVNQPDKDDSDVVMTDASPATTQHSPPKPLSQTMWTREHWLLMDQLLQLRRKGPFEGGFDRSPASEKLVGKTVTSQGEGMRLQSWHMDCVDAFRFEVGGWEEKVLAMRLFALLLGEVRRAKGREEVVEDDDEGDESVMFH